VNKASYANQNLKIRSYTDFKAKFLGLTTSLILSQTIYASPLPAFAADGDIKVSGQTIFTTNTGDGTSISQRAQAIQTNLDNALVIAQDRSPNAVGITYVQGSPVITLGGYLITKVTPEDGAFANTTPALVADQWASAMRKALANNQSINAYVSQLNSSSQPAAVNQPPSRAANNYGNGNPSGNYDTYSSNSAPAFSSGRNSTSPVAPQQAQSDSGYGQQGYGGQQRGYAQQNPGYYQQPGVGSPNQATGYRQGRVAQAPAGQIISVSLATAIATQVAKPGDFLQANITQNINLGDSVIPAGSVVIGQVAEAEKGRMLARSGELQIKFNRIRTPDGSETPISAHIVGGIGKYSPAGGNQSDTYKGETMGNKLGSVAFRGLLGAGGGAALGTAVGAIAGQSGTGAGRGAWSGTAIGGGLGVADSLLLRKGNDITVPAGTTIQLQLDSPVSIAGVVPAGY
jgi:hypothetical protein